MKQYLVTEGNDYHWYSTTECKSLSSARRIYSMVAQPDHAAIWRLHNEPGMIPRYQRIGYQDYDIGDVREADQFRKALGLR